jgi:hypothetical protein
MADLETMGGIRDEVQPGIFKDNAARLLGLATYDAESSRGSPRSPALPGHQNRGSRTRATQLKTGAE